jgi:hypothetical protein
MERGGKREGAGRKAAPESRKRPLAMRIDPELAEYLDSVEDKTAAIETALRNSKAFKEWRRRK